MREKKNMRILNNILGYYDHFLNNKIIIAPYPYYTFTPPHVSFELLIYIEEVNSIILLVSKLSLTRFLVGSRWLGGIELLASIIGSTDPATTSFELNKFLYYASPFLF